jgi:hypothetical protein
LGIRKAFITGARKGRLKVNKYTAATILSAGFFPSEELAVILDASTMKPFKKYKIDLRSVVVQGARIIRARPRFEPWAIRMATEVDSILDKSAIETFGNLAGDIVGLGDYRIEKMGLFGQFTVAVEE